MTSYTNSTRLAAEVVRYVQRQFGDESGVQVTNDDVLRWVNAGQQEIYLRNEPLKATAYADIVAGQEGLRITCVSTYASRAFSLMESLLSSEALRKLRNIILREDPQYIGQGQPVVWSEWGGTITFYPTPERDQTNGMTLKYVKTSTPVVTINDVLSIPDAYLTVSVSMSAAGV